MNARLMKKRLKKQIDELQKDNRLMRRIVEDSPEMQRLYDRYTQPLNVTHTTIPIQEFKAGRVIPPYMANDKESIELMKQSVAEGLFDVIKENISYEIDIKHEMMSITGSIFIGRKE